MLICNRGHIFDRPMLSTEESGEEFGYCPLCYSEVYEEAQRCEDCNRLSLKLEDSLCPECRRKIYKDWKDLIQPILDKHFTQADKEHLINSIYDGSLKI